MFAVWTIQDSVWIYPSWSLDCELDAPCDANTRVHSVKRASKLGCTACMPAGALSSLPLVHADSCYLNFLQMMHATIFLSHKAGATGGKVGEGKNEGNRQQEGMPDRGSRKQARRSGNMPSEKPQSESKHAGARVYTCTYRRRWRHPTPTGPVCFPGSVCFPSNRSGRDMNSRLKGQLMHFYLSRPKHTKSGRVQNALTVKYSWRTINNGKPLHPSWINKLLAARTRAVCSFHPARRSCFSSCLSCDRFRIGTSPRCVATFQKSSTHSKNKLQRNPKVPANPKVPPGSKVPPGPDPKPNPTTGCHAKLMGYI